MSRLPEIPEHLRPLAPGYTPRQVAIDAEMVALGRPAGTLRTLLDAKARIALATAVEAWEYAHESTTDVVGGPCKCGAPMACGMRWLELRGQARAEEARLYEERYGAEAYAREQLRVVGFESALIDTATSMRGLRDSAAFVATRDWRMDGTKWCLVLIGPPGCGKSQAATWAAHQLLMRNFAPRCVRCPKVSEGLLYGGEAEEYRWRCAQAGVLVLDDLGEGEQRHEKRSVWRAWVDDVLTQRHAERRRTIVTTNRSIDELSAWLGARLIDRLREGELFGTNEQSMRGAT